MREAPLDQHGAETPLGRRRHRGAIMLGPVQHEVLASSVRSTAQVTVTSPSGTDNAPYLAAFVASSWIGHAQRQGAARVQRTAGPVDDGCWSDRPP